ncbi:MAG: hypothetical protein JW945_05020 [Methanomicrobia archaeon]|nr:hypothetical protein [Methanomicrobia archaeon]
MVSRVKAVLEKGLSIIRDIDLQLIWIVYFGKYLLKLTAVRRIMDISHKVAITTKGTLEHAMPSGISCPPVISR